MSTPAPAPLISVLMANYNCATFLKQAIDSVLAQTHTHLELILVDDGSSDGSLEIAHQIAATDPRLRVFSGFRFGGPAPVRNFALEQARGEWVAIVDSDDHIHPERFEKLLAYAGHTTADILIDDLLIFSDEPSTSHSTLFSGDLSRTVQHISVADYVMSNCLYGKGSGLGYAKPLIRRACIEANGIRYNETMRIGEDYDLIYRLMQKGCSLYSAPELLYFYRKHSGSISHRLDRASLDALYAGARAAVDETDASTPLYRVLHERRKSIEKAIGFDSLVSALKARNFRQFLATCLKTPSALPLLTLPISDRLKAKRKRLNAPDVDVAVIARQRIVGNTNGSSVYLLALCRYLSDQGYRVGMYWPSPETFGRWPVLALKSEMDFLTDVQWRGGIKFGRYVFSTSMKTYWSFFLTAVEAVLLKLKVIRSPVVPRALSALKAPYRTEDYLFLAPRLQNRRAVIADYAFCTPYLDYRLSPSRTLVLMHDLFSSRPGQFSGESVKDDYGQFTFDEEIRHLKKADAIIAIQRDEAEIISPYLKGTPVMVAPMSASTAGQAAPGDNDTVFFVGSQAAPNVIGLEWFFQKVWPIVLSRRPATRLKVAGSVGRAVTAVPDRVDILGLVDDLKPLYAEAGVVVSPLTTGSGLKIKIIEALSHGKACVVTGITLQGIADIAGSAVLVEDEPQEFADAVIHLLNDPEARFGLATKALACVKDNFSDDRSFRPVRAFIDG